MFLSHGMAKRKEHCSKREGEEKYFCSFPPFFHLFEFKFDSFSISQPSTYTLHSKARCKRDVGTISHSLQDLYFRCSHSTFSFLITSSAQLFNSTRMSVTAM